MTKAIRTTAITDHVSQIASYGAIRELLVTLQKQMAISKGVVMDGRDIGTHVMPDAEIKVFLTASVTERAERRFKEMQSSGTCTLTLSNSNRTSLVGTNWTKIERFLRLDVLMTLC